MTDCIQELICIIQSPEIYIQRVETQEAMSLIAGFPVWQSPFVLRCMLWLRGAANSIDGQRAKSRELSRVSDMYIIQGTVECILFRRSWVIGDLDSRLILRGIMVDIQVGTFIKAMMKWLWGWRREIVVDVRETIAISQLDST